MILDILVKPGLIRYLEDVDGISRDCYTSVEMTLEFDSRISFKRLLEELHIPDQECGMVLYNEKRISQDDEIAEDGSIKIYPPILGG